MHFLSELNSEWGPHFWMQLIQIFRPRRKLTQEREWLRCSLSDQKWEVLSGHCTRQPLASLPKIKLFTRLVGFARPLSWRFYSTPFLVFSLALLIFFSSAPVLRFSLGPSYWCFHSASPINSEMFAWVTTLIQALAKVKEVSSWKFIPICICPKGCKYYSTIRDRIWLQKLQRGFVEDLF